MEAYLKPYKIWPGIFRTLPEDIIQNLVQLLDMKKPGILVILEYSELFHNCILQYIQNPVIFTKI